MRLDRGAHRSDVDHAVAHHAAVVENVFGRHQPVADVKRKQSVFAGARDLRKQFRIPPDVIDVERDTECAAAIGIERVADVERLLGRIDAGAVGGIGGMQRFDCERHVGLPGVFQHFGDGIVDLRASSRNILGGRAARPRILRQAPDHQHQARRAERLGLIDRAAIVVAHFDPMRGVRNKHAAAAITG